MARFLVVSMLVSLVIGCGGRPATATMTKTSTARQLPLPAPRVYRVVTLGDSLAYGTGDESGKGIAGRLDRDSFSTLNLAVNGAQTTDLRGKLGQKSFRDRIVDADAIVLSIGANDLFRSQRGREEALRDPIGVATKILDRIDDIVSDLHQVAPNARIVLLGGYNPVPKHSMAPLIDHYLELWNATLANRFNNDPLVSVVRMDDIVTPSRLSRHDGFHPGAAAYDEAANRVAALLRKDDRG
jgi:lysophospholipase L1-like esterase